MKFLLLCVLLGITLAAIDLPYQAHSFNDLDYFIQLLKKGVKTFKLDLSMVSRSSCLNHSSWLESRNPCQTFEAYAQEICCLGFRGDASSTPEFNYEFNTSYEFVALLARKDLLPILRKPIFIAINFQYTDSMNNLTKTFLYDMMHIIADLKLNVTICSGTKNIILDYDYKCVIQGQCKNDTVSQYISNSNIVLQTSDYEPYHPHDVYKRYRNFNVFYKEIDRFCANGFPAWVDKYNYPLIFWEPSNEKQIQYVAKTFLSDSCKRPAKHNTIASLAITSNLQPEMFQTYFQNYEKDTGAGKKYLLTNTSNLLLSKISIAGKDYVLTASKQTKDNTSVIQLRDCQLNIFKQLVLAADVTVLRSNNNTIMVYAQNSTGYYTQIYNTDLQIIREWALIEKYYAIDYFNGLAYYIKKVSETYYNLLITPDGKSSSITGCDVGFSPTDMVMVDQLYIVGTKNGSIYLNYNCTASVLIGFGTTATISTGTKSSTNFLQIFIQNGMCQSAVLANNNEMNKCTFYKNNEFNQLQSVPNMINFVSGSVEDFKAIRDNKDPITACHNKLFAGKIANGNKPSQVMWNGDRMLVAYGYIPLSKQPLITTLFCGGSNFDNVQTSSDSIISWFSLPGLDVQSSDQNTLSDDKIEILNDDQQPRRNLWDDLFKALKQIADRFKG